MRFSMPHRMRDVHLLHAPMPLHTNANAHQLSHMPPPPRATAHTKRTEYGFNLRGCTRRVTNSRVTVPRHLGNQGSVQQSLGGYM